MTKPIHPSLAIACGDLLQHAMWVTSCSDCDVFVEYAAHVGYLTVRVLRKGINYDHYSAGDRLCSFRLELDVYDYELCINKVQWAIDAITVHRGKCFVSAHAPKDGSVCDCVEADDVIPF